MMAKTRYYTPNSKMADLLSDHYCMLTFISRFNIPLGVEEKTIKDVCIENNIDLETFIFIVHFLLFREKKSKNQLSETLSIPMIIKFLGNSHSYFLDYRLPSMGAALFDAISDAPEEIILVIKKYFEEYVIEVRQHMEYENDIVFPYVLRLLKGEKDPDYNIEIFDKRHDQVELKMLELKTIFIKYYHSKSDHRINNIIHDLFSCEYELRDHNDIEDEIFIPCIREIEQKMVE
ncbi:MAG: hemerythrin domain-containing protein [Porphyromonas sp.]|nr:hemerythrin domain-containing protein [Porphyromonas sp.]